MVSGPLLELTGFNAEAGAEQAASVSDQFADRLYHYPGGRAVDCAGGVAKLFHYPATGCRNPPGTGGPPGAGMIHIKIKPLQDTDSISTHSFFWALIAILCVNFQYANAQTMNDNYDTYGGLKAIKAEATGYFYINENRWFFTT
jgi:hypothetical protein